MKLFLTASSERGKAVTKSGNEFMKLVMQDESRNVFCIIAIDLQGELPKIEMNYGNNVYLKAYKGTDMDYKPKTAREKYTEYYCQDCDEVNHNGDSTCPKCKGQMSFYTEN